MLWFLNIKVSPKWVLPKDILCQGHPHCFLPLPPPTISSSFLSNSSLLVSAYWKQLKKSLHIPVKCSLRQQQTSVSWECDRSRYRTCVMGTFPYGHSNVSFCKFVRPAGLLINQHLQINQLWVKMWFKDCQIIPLSSTSQELFTYRSFISPLLCVEESLNHPQWT